MRKERNLWHQCGVALANTLISDHSSLRFIIKFTGLLQHSNTLKASSSQCPHKEAPTRLTLRSLLMIQKQAQRARKLQQLKQLKVLAQTQSETIQLQTHVHVAETCGLDLTHPAHPLTLSKQQSLHALPRQFAYTIS
jgi:hypothetical protein